MKGIERDFQLTAGSVVGPTFFRYHATDKVSILEILLGKEFGSH